MKRKMVPVYLRTLISIGVLAGAGGCATTRLYDGEPLPEDKLSIIEKGDARLCIASLDGIADDRMSSSKFALLPGQHTASLSFFEVVRSTTTADTLDEFKSSANVTITFATEAGHKYLLSCIEDCPGLLWTPVLTDVTKGERIPSAWSGPLRKSQRHCETGAENWLEEIHRVGQMTDSYFGTK